MQKLLDIVVEQLFEAHTSVLDAVHELHRPLAKKLKTFLKTDDVLCAYWIDFSPLVKYFDSTCWNLREESTKFVTSPLYAM